MRPVRRAPWLLFLLKAGLCLLVAVRTEVPHRDGVTYLWMAQEAASGDVAALFATVFHPFYPALISMVGDWLPGASIETVGQVVASAGACLALFPLWAVTRSLHGERAALWTAACYAIATWFARHPAECVSEGVFFLFASLWAWALLRPRCLPVLAGTMAALAYLTRPEGAALLVLGVGWSWLRRERGLALEQLLPALLFGSLLPLGFLYLGDGFTLTPKAAFNWAVGVGDPEAGGWGHLLPGFVALPGAALEELGYLIFPLAVAGVVLARPRRLADPHWLLLAPFLLQCALVPMLRTHFRFLACAGVLLLPFAGLAAVGLWDALARRRPLLPWLLPVLLLASEARVLAPRNRDRAVERDLGVHLGALLGPHETLAADMPRLVFFAGLRPPEPRPIRAAELLAAAKRPECRFLAWVGERTPGMDHETLRELGLEPLDLPALLSATARRRGVLVYGKKPPR